MTYNDSDNGILRLDLFVCSADDLVYFTPWCNTSEQLIHESFRRLIDITQECCLMLLVDQILLHIAIAHVIAFKSA
jgi:hypothetical protein